MKTILISGVALGALVSAQASAQTVNNNFSRDRNTAVTDRAHPEYAPLGVKAGAFLIEPTLTVGVGGNDNIYYVPTNEEASPIITIAPEVTGKTTWSRHELGFQAGVASEVYTSQSDENNTGFNVGVNGRLDINSKASVAGSVAHVKAYESRSAYTSSVEAAEPTRIDSDSANLQLTLIGNRLRFIGSLTTRKDNFFDVASLAGGTLSQRYRDLTTNSASARFDYAISPAVSVFLTAASNTRRYETATINDSDGTILAVGANFDISSIARGEFQLGTLNQDYKDPTVGSKKSGYANAKVQWFPTQLTTLTGTLSRDFRDYPASGGTTRTALNTEVGFSVDHELLRNLIVSAGIRGQKYEFDGIDRTDTGKSLRLGGRYLVNRRVSVDGSYSYTTYDSKGANAFRDYNANVLMMTVVFSY